MSRPGLLALGCARAKEYLPAVIAASVMYGGINQIIKAVNYVVTGVILAGINAVIRQGFRDRTPLPNPYLGSWRFHVQLIAVGLIVLVLGSFLGLWVQARSKPRRAL